MQVFEWVHPSKKHVYQLHEGSAAEKNLLGLKGTNLCELYRLQLPIPPAFIITTETSLEFFAQKQDRLKEQVVAQIKNGIQELESQTGKTFGKHEPPHTPLLLSVRSGAAVAMPGAMQTVLNLGMNDEIVAALAGLTNNPRWAYDCYRRFLHAYGTAVLGADSARYDTAMKEAHTARGVTNDTQLTVADLVEVVTKFKTFAAVPHDPWEQLHQSVEVCFSSWFTPNAMKFRDIHCIQEPGTAVVVQSMVYGNWNARSGTGIMSTRNPLTGDKEMYGEFLQNAESQDVIAGDRFPLRLSELQQAQEWGPALYDDLRGVEGVVEKHYRDMQDVEFVVQDGTLYLLQSRSGKRSARAAVSVAASMVRERLIGEREALMRIDPNTLDFFLHPSIDVAAAPPDDPSVTARVIGRGVGVSPGAAVGRVVFSGAEAEESVARGEPCILVRMDTGVDDEPGLQACTGGVVICGGRTSHAALTARSMGKPAVVGTLHLRLDESGAKLSATSPPAEGKVEEQTARERAGDTGDAGGWLPEEELVEEGIAVGRGTLITVDGTNGVIYLGEMPTVRLGQDTDFQQVMGWADTYKHMVVQAVVQKLDDIKRADAMGCDGIGLLRTEEMFLGPDRISHFRCVILSDDLAVRQAGLDALLPLQTQDFVKIFRTMGRRQVCIRLLDYPLHAFVPRPDSPSFEQEMIELAAQVGISMKKCKVAVDDLQEVEPMLGCRGSRLAIMRPEITQLQVQAIVGAAIFMRDTDEELPPTQIMIPLVCTHQEVSLITPVITQTADAVCRAMGSCHSLESLGCGVCSMIELPRACLHADRIAQCAHINMISIGSDSLTKYMFGFSGEDAYLFMQAYIDGNLIAADPFLSLDVHGVGGMVQMAIQKAREAQPGIHVSVTGEHGGDPASIRFFYRAGVDCVSCPPNRVPIAKIAAAQAYIQQTSNRYRRFTEPSSPGPFLLPPLSPLPFI